jgi:hypothetical protein
MTNEHSRVTKRCQLITNRQPPPPRRRRLPPPASRLPPSAPPPPYHPLNGPQPQVPRQQTDRQQRHETGPNDDRVVWAPVIFFLFFSFIFYRLTTVSIKYRLYIYIRICIVMTQQPQQDRQTEPNHETTAQHPPPPLRATARMGESGC